MATLPELLKSLVEMDGSDLHITTASPPQVRVHGHLQRLALPDLGPSETKQLVYSVLTDAQKKRYEETQELDFSFGIKGLARFRCNVFSQRGATGAVYRVIPEKIRSFGDLGLPAVIANLAERPRGLVLVPAEQAVKIFPEEDLLEGRERHALVHQRILRALLVERELGLPVRFRQRRDRAGHWLPLRDRKT